MGHFSYPFWVFALMLLIIYPICSYILTGASREAYNQLLIYRSDPVLALSLPIPVFDQPDI